MEIILANLDLLLIGIVIIIAAVVFARRGQIELLRELIVSLADSVDAEQLYEKLPTVTKMLVSDKTLDKLVRENKTSGVMQTNL